MEQKDPPWAVARRGIEMLLNDKNKEAEILFLTSPQDIHITAGTCYLTFLNALMCFDDKKVNEALAKIKKIEEQCANQIGWVKSFKNKLLFANQEEGKSLEQTLEEKIVLADSLVCQSFLTFLHNDFTSYMKGGWTLRRAWKIYQYTHEQLSAIHKRIFGNCAISGWSSCTINCPSNETATSSLCNLTKENEYKNKDCEEKTDDMEEDTFLDATDEGLADARNANFYSCTSKTFSDFTSLSMKENQQEVASIADELDSGCDWNDDESALTKSDKTIRPRIFKQRYSVTNGHAKRTSIPNHCEEDTSYMRKSVSLFSSLNNFSYALLESASSLMGLSKESYREWENMEPETVLRLMSAVSFGYGVFQLCVSLAPPNILRWVNMLGFEGDQAAAVRSLNYSRKGSDMRAPLASLALLWYYTIVRPFFNLDGSSSSNFGIEEATKILNEENEYENSALFLFFKGRVERLKPNIEGAIAAYQMSVEKATLPEVKLLGLHEVGWCHLLTLDFNLAYKCFYQLKQQSKWSKSFYAYLTTICVGATGNTNMVYPGKAEIKYFLDKSPNKGAQIEKYIRRRMEKLPDRKDPNEEYVKDPLYWKLFCFEMLYLWNTFHSCKSSDLIDIVLSCTPKNGNTCICNEPMKGISWLIKGAASLILANRCLQNCDINKTENSSAYLTNAVDAFRMCLQLRSKCSDDAHISAFAQYELALLLLNDELSFTEGKVLLIKLQSQYKDYDFEQRLNVRVNATLKNIEKYELVKKSNENLNGSFVDSWARTVDIVQSAFTN